STALSGGRKVSTVMTATRASHEVRRAEEGSAWTFSCTVWSSPSVGTAVSQFDFQAYSPLVAVPGSRTPKRPVLDTSGADLCLCAIGRSEATVAAAASGAPRGSAGTPW